MRFQGFFVMGKEGNGREFSNTFLTLKEGRLKYRLPYRFARSIEVPIDICGGIDI